jgi:hypothetical protein
MASSLILPIHYILAMVKSFLSSRGKLRPNYLRYLPRS